MNGEFKVNTKTAIIAILLGITISVNIFSKDDNVLRRNMGSSLNTENRQSTPSTADAENIVVPDIQEPSVEPIWTNYPPIRSVNNLGKVLSDIEGHMPAGHIYRDSDKITWAHETSHGIHSQLRQKYSRRQVYFRRLRKVFLIRFPNERINGFYCLDNKAVIINEPNTTISAAARLVPNSLRGKVYNLYMVQQAASWGSTPLYIFDEWVSYTNGSACRLDLKIRSRSETVSYMLEFNVYAISLAMACKTEDTQFKNFLMWHLERTMDLYKESKALGENPYADEYLAKMRTGSDANQFREFSRNYFGGKWTKRILGF